MGWAKELVAMAAAGPEDELGAEEVEAREMELLAGEATAPSKEAMAEERAAEEAAVTAMAAEAMAVVEVETAGQAPKAAEGKDCTQCPALAAPSRSSIRARSEPMNDHPKAP